MQCIVVIKQITGALRVTRSFKWPKDSMPLATELYGDVRTSNN